MKILHCLQQIDTSLDPRSRLLLAEAYRLIGQSYGEIYLYDQSCDYYQQVYDIVRPLNDQHCLYRATFDLGRSLMLKTNYVDALDMFHRLVDQISSDRERAYVYQHVSECYLNMQDVNQAKHYAYQALDYASKENEDLLRIDIHIVLGKIYFQLKDFSRAEDNIVYAQTLKDQLGYLEQMTDLDEFLLRIRHRHDTIVQQVISTLNIHKNTYDNKQPTHSWISAAMHKSESCSIVNDDNEIIEKINTNNHRWRLLTPYARLFDICTTERKRKYRRQIDYVKQPLTTTATASITTPSPSLPCISTAGVTTTAAD
jgi:tetratricopeptide (TPR) repeat protein